MAFSYAASAGVRAPRVRANTEGSIAATVQKLGNMKHGSCPEALKLDEGSPNAFCRAPIGPAHSVTTPCLKHSVQKKCLPATEGSAAQKMPSCSPKSAVQMQHPTILGTPSLNAAADPSSSHMDPAAAAAATTRLALGRAWPWEGGAAGGGGGG
jgi:hypothetical protein